MTPELWERLKPLYSAALDLPEEEHPCYIEQVCKDDPELERELRALIAADRSAANTLASPLADVSFSRLQPNTILEPGRVLAGRFRIVQHLGSGGMGDVYEAVDLQLEQGRIALKTLRPEIAGNPNALARFKEEVLLARKITGPNICRIHELYLTGSSDWTMPIAFLTMELLEGATLHEHIEQHSPMPVAEIRLFAEQLCCALSCIHEAGIIHRDLKTRNVMLVPHAGTHKVVVMDFGLALLSAPGPRASAGSLQPTGFMAGTPSYMAPEQFEGREAGPPTDIYALGLVLYEMATGVQPFAAQTPLAAAIRRGQQPRFVSSFRHELPPTWDDIIQRCLDYDPAKRFQSANEITEALKHPGKIVLRLGSKHRLIVPRVVFLASTFTLAVAVAIASWMLVTDAQRRKLTPEAAHWYALGMTALREGSYLKATKLLTKVTERDPTYALAHAALADAWSELDFTEQAQREMLLASSAKEQRGLSDLDRHYIDAVRTTLIRDYSAAAQDYEAILEKDPLERRADGYVDLGRIYEKAGKVNETLAAYEKAAQLNPDDPAPFLHLGVLKSRLREPQAATQAFNRAESLYGAESDLEGLAEIAYQRGYAANEAGKTGQAKQNLERSLTLARQIPSTQMEVRSLSQLSTVAYNESRDEEAIADANTVIETARENGLEYWATDGLIRLSNALLDKENYTAAERPAEEALGAAQKNGHPRLEANAELTLASIRNEQRQWSGSVVHAKKALGYYQDYGFMNSADKAQMLVLRGLREQGDYPQALEAGFHLIHIAELTHSAIYAAVAEELVGGVMQRLERYPEALAHFQHATQDLLSINEDPAYQQVHCAEALAQLGRYEEAEATLASVSDKMRTRKNIGASIRSASAAMKQSQRNPRAALASLRDAWSWDPELRSTPGELERIMVLAELQLGQEKQAAADLATLTTYAQSQNNAVELAKNQFLGAMVLLSTKDPATARSQAHLAEQLFEQKGMLESVSLSLLLEARAAQAMGDLSAADSLSKMSVVTFRRLEQQWGASSFKTYAARPDRHQDLLALALLRGVRDERVEVLIQ